jgi:hypothetical protein
LAYRDSQPRRPHREEVRSTVSKDEGRGVKSQTPMVHFANSLDIRPELLYSARLNLQQDAEIQRTWSFPRGFPGSRNGRS